MDEEEEAWYLWAGSVMCWWRRGNKVSWGGTYDMWTMPLRVKLIWAMLRISVRHRTTEPDNSALEASSSLPLKTI